VCSRVALALLLLAAGCVTQEAPVLSVKPGWGGCRSLEAPLPGDGIQVPGPSVSVPPGATDYRSCGVIPVPRDLDVITLERSLARGAEVVDVYLVPYELPGCSDGRRRSDDCACIRENLNPALSEPALLATFQNGLTSWSTPKLHSPDDAPRDVALRLLQGHTLLVDVTYQNEKDRSNPLEQALCLNLRQTHDQYALPVSTLFDEVRGFLKLGQEEVTRYCRFPEDLNVVSMAGFFSVFGYEGNHIEVQAWRLDAAGMQIGDDLLYENPDAVVPRWLSTDASLGDISWTAPQLVRGFKLRADFRDERSRDTHVFGGKERLGAHLVFYPPPNRPLDPRCYCYFEGESPDPRERLGSGETLPCPDKP
jgi:hypothetical protein